jgi:hypothetical protein
VTSTDVVLGTYRVGCTDVRAERVLPETLAAPLAAALASA